jgi:hypothetical protein
MNPARPLDQLSDQELVERLDAGRATVRQAKAAVRNWKNELHSASARLRETEEQCRRRGIRLVVVPEKA